MRNLILVLLIVGVLAAIAFPPSGLNAGFCALYFFILASAAVVYVNPQTKV